MRWPFLNLSAAIHAGKKVTFRPLDPAPLPADLQLLSYSSYQLPTGKSNYRLFRLDCTRPACVFCGLWQRRPGTLLDHLLRKGLTANGNRSS